MKKYIICQWSVIVALLLMTATSCNPEKVDPPLSDIPVGEVLTLKKLKDLSLPYTFDYDASVYATVTMDESTGNIYKQLYVQDVTDGFSLQFDDATTLKEGDSVRIYLKGKTVSRQNETYQIDDLNAIANVVLIERNRFVEPEETTMEQIYNFNASKEYHLKLIKLMDVQFLEAELGATWGDATTQANVNRNLENCGGESIIVRTSGHATFADKELPRGKGSLVAILGVYNTTMQLWVRSMDEVDMSGGRCGENVIFSETFASGQGNFTIFNKVGEETTWTFNEALKAMEIKRSDKADEDWLISPSIKLTGINETISFSFEHAINKVPDGVSKEYMKMHHKVMISENYNGGDPAMAEWTEFTLTDNDLPSGRDWIEAKAELTFPESVSGAENVRIAFKYSCDETESATWRIKNVIVEKQ
ncbi:MAG: DUF5689 domain-containing protein [Bacteroidales bacterium]|nr:DUF5689 domain-containing protein [Bacteroidales bacterium]